MIHVMLPSQYLRRGAVSRAEPLKRLMAAVLQTAMEDCRSANYRRAMGHGAISLRDAHEATAYVASSDRAWPFSFENLCDALDLDAGCLRRELRTLRVSDQTVGAIDPAQSIDRIVEGARVVPVAKPVTAMAAEPPSEVRVLPPAAVRPPSTTSAAPATKRASSLAR